MTRKRSKTTRPPKYEGAAAGERPQKGVGRPDTSILARYAPTGGPDVHPDWVKERFPTYIGAHTGHETTSVREFTHDGHAVRIVTTYSVEVDGNPVRGHLSVDEDGRVYTHATPFVSYASAVDLVKAVIDHYPGAFAGTGHGDAGHGHGVPHP